MGWNNSWKNINRYLLKEPNKVVLEKSTIEIWIINKQTTKMSQPMKNSERNLNPLPWTERPKTFSCFPCYHTCGSASSEHSETLKSQSFLFQAWYSQNILRLYCFRVTRLWACWGTHVVILAEYACCEHVVSLSYWSFFCSKFNQSRLDYTLKWQIIPFNREVSG